MDTARTTGKLLDGAAPEDVPRKGVRTDGIPKKYEELDGAQGRAVFFRPERYRTADLGPVHPVVKVWIDNDTIWECDLHDVSQNGVAFRCPDSCRLETGAVVSIKVLFDGYEAYKGEARVSSIRDLEGSVVAGVSFIDSLMDIEDVLHLRDVKTWDGDLARSLSLSGRPWHVEGHHDFKALVGELRLFFEDAKQQMDRMESSLPWQVVHGDGESAARAALVDLIRAQFVNEFLVYAERLDAALRHATPAEWQALKEFSLRNVHEAFMLSPFMHRARYKPLGYPGDYEVMNYIYSRHFEGQTLFAKAVNLATLSTPAAAAVRTRKDLIRAELEDVLRRSHDHERPVRIISIASGPAQETYELLAKLDSISVPIQIILFDQDKRALAYAYGRLKRLVDTKWPKDVQITYLHDSIKRLLNDPEIFKGFGMFDATVCAGLFDYLPLRTAVTLCGNLFRNIAHEGVLYIGNMVPTNPTRWIMEHHLDWYLTYRTRAEMLELARLGAPDAEVRILEETTGVNPFLKIRKRLDGDPGPCGSASPRGCQ